MESKFLQHGLGSTYVEGDDDAGRVVLGQLDGGAEEAVEVVVRGHEPGTCEKRTAAEQVVSVRDRMNGRNGGMGGSCASGG